MSAAEIVEFCYETLAEQRRDRRIGDGVLLTTLHGAKGLEFPHVLIADGGWRQRANADSGAAMEEERRLFYVGMTRARETLTLGDLANGSRANPHIGLIDGDWLLRGEPTIAPPAPEILARRYARLGLADLDLGYAGGYAADAPIHHHLAALSSGDRLGFRAEGDRVLLFDVRGHSVARLSRRAAAQCSQSAKRCLCTPNELLRGLDDYDPPNFLSSLEADQQLAVEPLQPIGDTAKG